MSVFILIANRLQLDRKRETGASIIFKVAEDYPSFLRFRQREQMRRIRVYGSLKEIMRGGKMYFDYRTTFRTSRNRFFEGIGINSYHHIQMR
jgi:hypothetical protein